ncbi:hypothetical protein CXY01_18180 [Cellulomonas xylanilytica]|uniref:Uncharacterized protein n=1 Tax=Cellulomonas xylanilytica TaxID=233583 RepID=A0A510V345_9CELL|nr:hypothetical protein CXY01_18180 [Cellulomonas xylanilytica]
MPWRAGADIHRFGVENGEQQRPPRPDPRTPKAGHPSGRPAFEVCQAWNRGKAERPA